MGVVGEAPGTVCGEHVLQLHRTEDERLAELTAWVSCGLDLGQKVLCTELPCRPEDSLVARLEARGVAARVAVREGRLVVRPAAEFYADEGHAAVVERALAEGFPAVRMSAERHAALTVLSPDAHWTVEQRMDELVCTRPVHTLCQYQQDATRDGLLGEAVALHRSGVRTATFTSAADLDGLALSGEVDAGSTDVFRAALAAAVRTATRVLWLDLGAVTHLDAGDCWALDDLTRTFRIAGGHVLLVAPQPAVEVVLELMEVLELPGMHLLAGRS